MTVVTLQPTPPQTPLFNIHVHIADLTYNFKTILKQLKIIFFSQVHLIRCVHHDHS